MNPITAPGIYPDVTPKEYHADPVATPSLSSTIAKMLVSQSPRHAWLKHPRLGGAKATPEDGDEAEEPKEKITKEKELGTLLHRLILGKGGEIVVCPFENWRSNAAKSMRVVEMAKGNIAVLQPALDRAKLAAKEARFQLDALGLDRVFRDGLKEVTVVWREGETWLRAMMDNLIIDEDSKTAEIWDLKTVSRSAHPDACAAQIRSLGYDLSASFYKQALGAVRPDLNGRVKFRWVFLEVNAPYATTPVEIDGEWENVALSHFCRAVDGWKRCIAANKWPVYADKIIRLEPKPWMLPDAMGSDEIAANVA
jgi:hypothetical protein